MEESEVDEGAGATAQDQEQLTSSFLVGQGSPVNVQTTTPMASQEALQEHEGAEGLVRNSGETTTSSEGKTQDRKQITCPFCSTELFVWRHKFCFECGTSIKDIIEQLEGNSTSSSDIQVPRRGRARAQPGKVVVVSGFVEPTKQNIGVAEASSQDTDVQHGSPPAAPLDNVAIGSKRSSDRSSVKVDTENAIKKTKHGGESIEKNLAEDSGEAREPGHGGQNKFDDGQNPPQSTESPENSHQFDRQNEEEMEQSPEGTQRQIYEESRSEVDENKTESMRSGKTDAVGEQTQAAINEHIEKQSVKNESEVVGSNTETGVHGQVELEANKDIQRAGQHGEEQYEEFDDNTHTEGEKGKRIEVSGQVKQERNEDIEGTGQLGGEEQKGSDDPTTIKVENERNSSETEIAEPVKLEGNDEDIQGVARVGGEEQGESGEGGKDPTDIKAQSGRNNSESKVAEQVNLQGNGEGIQGATQGGGEEQGESGEGVKDPTNIKVENEGNSSETKVAKLVKVETNDEDFHRAATLGEVEQGESVKGANAPTQPGENDDSEGTQGGETHEYVDGTGTSKFFGESDAEVKNEKKADGKEKVEDSVKPEAGTAVRRTEKLAGAHKEARDIEQDNKQQSGAVKDHDDIEPKSEPEGGDKKSKQSPEKSNDKPGYKRVFGDSDTSPSRSSGTKDRPQAVVTETPLSSESRPPGDQQGNSPNGNSNSGDGAATLLKMSRQYNSSQTSGNGQFFGGRFYKKPDDPGGYIPGSDANTRGAGNQNKSPSQTRSQERRARFWDWLLDKMPLEFYSYLLQMDDEDMLDVLFGKITALSNEFVDDFMLRSAYYIDGCVRDTVLIIVS